MENPSDEELVARARLEDISPERRRELINELFTRYHSRVAAWCFRVTGERESAADLAQDVLLRAHRSLDSWRAESRFSTWLFAITRNHCLNQMTAKSIRPEGSSETLDFEPLDSTTRRADEQLEADSEMSQMKELLRTELDRVETQVMTLHYGEEMTLDAITRLLSLSNPSGAKAYIVSARRKLKAAVSRLRPVGRTERGPDV